MVPRAPVVRRLPKTIKQLLEQATPKSSTSTTPLTSITGHVRSIRRQKRCTFALIEDGSTSEGLQAVFRHGVVQRGGTSTAMVEKLKQLTFGAAVNVTG
ncbi:hypothetical protein F5879DRAFT_79320, partial [Lentinula edodes]